MTHQRKFKASEDKAKCRLLVLILNHNISPQDLLQLYILDINQLSTPNLTADIKTNP